METKGLPSLHRAEILTISCSYFGRNDDFINSFWNCLTFSRSVPSVKVDLTLCSKCQIDGEDFINFCCLLRKHELYTKIQNLFRWIWIELYSNFDNLPWFNLFPTSYLTDRRKNEGIHAATPFGTLLLVNLEISTVRTAVHFLYTKSLTV